MSGERKITKVDATQLGVRAGAPQPVRRTRTIVKKGGELSGEARARGESARKAS